MQYIGIGMVALFVVGVLMYIYGIMGLIGLVIRAVGRYLKRLGVLGMMMLLILTHTGITRADEVKNSEVRRTCHVRTQYQLGADYDSTWWGSRLWNIELCVSYEEIMYQSGKKVVNAMSPARIGFNTFGPYGIAWDGHDCSAWIISPKNKEERFDVMGTCKVDFYTPFSSFTKSPWVRRNVWVGFTQGYRYEDFWYPSHVDYYREVSSDPLPFEDNIPDLVGE